jgi:hypothetical protein
LNNFIIPNVQQFIRATFPSQSQLNFSFLFCSSLSFHLRSRLSAFLKLPFLSLADGAAESTDMAAAPSTSTADETQAEGYLQTGAPALDASITEPETANTESSEAAAAAAGGEAGGSSVLQLTGRVEFAEEQEEVAQVPAPREAAVEEGAGSGDSIAAAPGGAPEAESAGSAESAARSAAPAADETKAAVGSEEVKAEALPEPAEDRPIDGSAVAAMAPIPNTEVTGEASPETLRVDALPSSGASSATALEQPNATPLVVDSSPAALKSSTANRATIAFAIRIALATLTGGALPSPLTTDASSGDVHVQSSTDSSGTTSSSPSTSDKEAAVLALQAGLDVLLAAEQAPKQAAAASEKPPSLIGALLHTQ